MENIKTTTTFQPTDSDKQFQGGSLFVSPTPDQLLNHSQETSEKSDNSSNSLIDDFKNIRFSCKHCLNKFRDLKQLLSHICSDADKTMNQSEKSEEPSNKTRSSTVLNSEKRFSCHQCCRSFKRRHHLLQHNRIHTGEKPYTCKHCGISFNQQSTLTKHNRIHTGEKPYTCKECGKSFSQQPHLITHNRIHTGEKPYICIVCGKSFSKRFNLTTHSRIHTDDNPYTCQVCGKSFGQRSNLIAHNRVHTGEIPYTCKECGKSFSSQRSLIRHDRLHTGVRPYKCQQCEQTFGRSDQLSRHLQKHHAESLKRDTLGKTINAGGVSTNLRNRPIEAPYKCQKCSKRFTLRISLNKHVCSHK